MARALGASTRGHALVPRLASPEEPGPDLASVLMLVDQAHRVASQAFWANTTGLDANELSALATLLMGVGQIVRRSRKPGMALAIGGVDGGGGLSITAVPKALRVGGVVVPFVRPQRKKLGTAGACRALPAKGGAR